MVDVAVCVLAAVTICALPCLARAGSPQAAQPSGLVTLNVIAVDGKGNPVDDLPGTDFQLYDNGRPQQIDFLRHIDSRLQHATALGPNDFSNRATTHFEHATLILFDLLNAQIESRSPAADYLIHALQPLESSDGLYLYLLTKASRDPILALYPVHGLPDPETPSTPTESAPWTRQIKPLLDQDIKAAIKARPLQMDVYDREALTYMALDLLAARMAWIPGRKNIVWITEGVPIRLGTEATGGVDYTPYLRKLSEKLDRANMCIYPVQIPGSQDTLQEFARYTGGHASNDVRAAIHEAMNDVRTSYQIGYHPMPENRDGKFHRIRVTCARKGVRVQAKEGYYAEPEPPFGAEQQREAIESAATAPFDAAEIGLRATLSPDDKNPHRAHLLLRIDPADVMLIREGSQYTGQLKIRVASFTVDGTAESQPEASMDLRWTPEQHDEIMKSSISFHDDLNLAQGVQKLRLVVLDLTSHAIGSVTIAPRRRAHRGRAFDGWLRITGTFLRRFYRSTGFPRD
jgi:VWFA-related protein